MKTGRCSFSPWYFAVNVSSLANLFRTSSGRPSSLLPSLPCSLCTTVVGGLSVLVRDTANPSTLSLAGRGVAARDWSEASSPITKSSGSGALSEGSLGAVDFVADCAAAVDALVFREFEALLVVLLCRDCFWLLCLACSSASLGSRNESRFRFLRRYNCQEILVDCQPLLLT